MHVGIIMDGNRRWAKEKGLSIKVGHEAGADNLDKLVQYVFKKGVKVLSVYAFSTENFKRDKKEVNNLMTILYSYLNRVKKMALKEKVKVVISGKKELLSDKINKRIEEVENDTSQYSERIFNICLAYGSHEELKDAFIKIHNDVNSGLIKDFDIKDYLYNDLPPIDLVIRTSGEERLSNFMLYQAAYSELYFTKVYFPDFNELEFDKALNEYNRRIRRFGEWENEL